LTFTDPAAACMPLINANNARSGAADVIEKCLDDFELCTEK
jgi:hypothetical protein